MTSYRKYIMRGIALATLIVTLASCGKKNQQTKNFTTTTITTKEAIAPEVKYSYQEYINTVYGRDTIIYNVDDENPYGIDLSSYGSGISAIFYTPKTTEDPYDSINRDTFYSQYQISLTYEDSKWRTSHGLISGQIKEEDYKPALIHYGINESEVKLTKGTYILSTTGDYLGYIPNSNDFVHPVFYQAGYVSKDDVAAYLLAFGSLPANSNYGTASTNRKMSCETWGIYGRCNKADFSGNVNKYPYEPLLPKIMGDGAIAYTETDYGTNGGYEYQFKGKKSKIEPYNTGELINRGICRFVFVSDKNVKSIDERHVFYTYNHYNDFQEYLNCEGMFGTRFGNESAGNPACSNASDWEDGYKSPTSYIAPELK